MIQLITPIQQLFKQIEVVLSLINKDTYSKPSTLLQNASIGKHVRHIIELFIELNNGYENGTINYDLRKRDYQLETNPLLAIDQFQQLLQKIDKPDKVIKISTDYTISETGLITLETNYYRELIYNIEHMVHHMALIRVAINEHNAVVLDKDFGVAISTLKFQQAACAQ